MAKERQIPHVFHSQRTNASNPREQFPNQQLHSMAQIRRKFLYSEHQPAPVKLTLRE